MEILKLDETSSTNTWLSENERLLNAPVFVYCKTQTAGRGQRGNYWESAAGKNMTGSFLFHPDNFPAFNQFRISEVISLAIVGLLENHGICAEIKWPNDIYVGDKKICGILVENVITGKYITRSIAGIGLNVNQEKFESDAPNPVSMKNLTEKDYNVDSIVVELVEYIEATLKLMEEPDELHTQFMDKLWRNDRHYYPFIDRLQNELIHARIESVAPDGKLTITTKNGENREYLFKEIEFLITQPQ